MASSGKNSRGFAGFLVEATVDDESIGQGASLVGFADCFASFSPHSLQNLCVRLFGVAHLVHNKLSDSPQSPQNFLPTGFADPHLEHFVILGKRSFWQKELKANVAFDC